jgi:ribonucleoside-diphosphate reductase alpha chain
MERVFQGKKWTLFTPNETPDLHDLSGEDFRKQYEAYEKLAQEGKMKAFKEVSAEELWRKILSMLFETGHPWITFKDACNLRSPQQHTGVIHSSNLCTEITLNTSNDEIAVCNLGSINIPNHLDEDGNLNKEKLEKSVTTAIRMLDNVIDINYYAVPQAENSNFKHRPIGLGIMGFQDALYTKKIPYASEEAVDFADESMELVSYMAISASSDLAKERGSYASYEGSLWSQGILPLDSIEILEKQRGTDYIEVDKTTRLDWEALRKKVISQGMRNSNTMAIAPTATIANITGLTQSIEPTYSNLFVKSNLSGEFTVINMYLVDALKEIDMWDEVMVYDLKNLNGSLESIARVPEEIKKLFATSFEVEPKWLIEAASRRQKWIDQSQSLNLYVSEPNGKKLDVMYRMAWLRGLKTTYYLRSRSATTTEKSTITNLELNAVKTEPKNYEQPEACSIDDPDCEACQ